MWQILLANELKNEKSRQLSNDQIIKFFKNEKAANATVVQLQLVSRTTAFIKSRHQSNISHKRSIKKSISIVKLKSTHQILLDLKFHSFMSKLSDIFNHSTMLQTNSTSFLKWKKEKCSDCEAEYLQKNLSCSIQCIACYLSSSLTFHEIHVTHPELRIISTRD